jgi:hypothetical protein
MVFFDSPLALCSIATSKEYSNEYPGLTKASFTASLTFDLCLTCLNMI